ncbi:lasso peptide isopeptide bond-forming cyclase [soil metagenome]
MSAFAGLFNRDFRPLAPDLRQSVSRALAPRRLAGWWEERDCAATGFDLSGPLGALGNLVVAADVRLDNRDDLLAALRLDPRSSPDSVLIAAAYRRWGTDCPLHLKGDFAFLLWDPDKQTFFGARDHLGVRPFYYHLSDQRFAAATTSRAIIAMGIDDALDEAGLADFVAGAFADTAISLHRQIRRLPPGHSITVDRTSVRIAQYWRISAVEPYLRSDAAEQFHALFENAVRCRMAGSETAGVMLSGGMDSSSIAAVAGRLQAAEGASPLPSYSMTFDAVPEWNEGPFIKAMLADGRFAATMIASGGHDPFADIDTILTEQDGPFLAYNHSLSRQIYRAAQTDGVSVLLDGHGGDEVVSHGFGRLNELGSAGQWRTLWREAGGIAAIYGIPTWTVFAPYTAHHRLVRSARWHWNSVQSRLGLLSPPPNVGPITTSLVARDLAARIGMEERHQPFQPKNNGNLTENDLHLATLSSPGQPYMFEVLDRVAAAAGVTARYPFYDRSLVEFCLSLPSDQKLNHGLPRYVLRQAMRGILPETVRLRRDKFDFRGQLAAGFDRHKAMLTQIVETGEGGIERFVNMDVARQALRAVLAAGKDAKVKDMLPLWRVTVLAKWLGRTDGSGVCDTARDPRVPAQTA